MLRENEGLLFMASTISSHKSCVNSDVISNDVIGSFLPAAVLLQARR